MSVAHVTLVLIPLARSRHGGVLAPARALAGLWLLAAAKNHKLELTENKGGKTRAHARVPGGRAFRAGSGGFEGLRVPGLLRFWVCSGWFKEENKRKPAPISRSPVFETKLCRVELMMNSKRSISPPPPDGGSSSSLHVSRRVAVLAASKQETRSQVGGLQVAPCKPHGSPNLKSPRELSWWGNFPFGLVTQTVWCPQDAVVFSLLKPKDTILGTPSEAPTVTFYFHGSFREQFFVWSLAK